ncbi:hypothetical protein J8273_4881 [Carpediemonas membranifera]|uniref:Uncharacterized protein n=1 Tax=Carpediemonas membranifera TaxID=201153 RepID=A0A8J6BAY8_9EUKA|nr:hypothetical protein J8273_4881 [Carpediemonas membranifera]|eukprot:KAG9393582.1 hypothetical protein J8273_4881 [Carpediemonas membranifera]
MAIRVALFAALYIALYFSRSSLFSAAPSVSSFAKVAANLVWAVLMLTSVTTTVLAALPLKISLGDGGWPLGFAYFRAITGPYRVVLAVVSAGVLITEFMTTSWMAIASFVRIDIAHAHGFAQLQSHRMRVAMLVVFVASPGVLTSDVVGVLLTSAVIIAFVITQPGTSPMFSIQSAFPSAVALGFFVSDLILRLWPFAEAGDRPPFVITVAGARLSMNTVDVRFAMLSAYSYVIIAVFTMQLIKFRHAVLHIGYGEHAHRIAVRRLVLIRRVGVVLTMPLLLARACMASILIAARRLLRLPDVKLEYLPLRQCAAWLDRILYGPDDAVYEAIILGRPTALEDWALTGSYNIKPPGNTFSEAVARYYCAVWSVPCDPLTSIHFLDRRTPAAELHAAATMDLGLALFSFRSRVTSVAGPVVSVEDHVEADTISLHTEGQLHALLQGRRVSDPNGLQEDGNQRPLSMSASTQLSRHRNISRVGIALTSQRASLLPIGLLESFRPIMGRDFGLKPERRLYCWPSDIRQLTIDTHLFNRPHTDWMLSLFTSCLPMTSQLLQLLYIGGVKTGLLAVDDPHHWTDSQAAVDTAVNGINDLTALGLPLSQELLRASLVRLQHRAVMVTKGLTFPHVGIEMERLRGVVSRIQENVVDIVSDMVISQIRTVIAVGCIPDLVRVDREQSYIDRPDRIEDLAVVQRYAITDLKDQLASSARMFESLMTTDRRFNTIARNTESSTLLVSYRSFLMTTFLDTRRSATIAGRIETLAAQIGLYAEDEEERAAAKNVLPAPNAVLPMVRGGPTEAKEWHTYAAVWNRYRTAIDAPSPGAVTQDGGHGHHKRGMREGPDHLGVAHMGLASASAAQRRVRRMRSKGPLARVVALRRFIDPMISFPALLSGYLALLAAIAVLFPMVDEMWHLSNLRRMAREVDAALGANTVQQSLWQPVGNATDPMGTCALANSTLSDAYCQFVDDFDPLLSKSFFGTDPFEPDTGVWVSPPVGLVEYYGTTVGSWGGPPITVDVDGAVASLRQAQEDLFLWGINGNSALFDNLPTCAPLITEGEPLTEACEAMIDTLEKVSIWQSGSVLGGGALLTDITHIRGQTAVFYGGATGICIALTFMMAIGLAWAALLARKADIVAITINKAVQTVQECTTSVLISHLLTLLDEVGSDRVYRLPRLQETVEAAEVMLSDPRLSHACDDFDSVKRRLHDTAVRMHAAVETPFTMSMPPIIDSDDILPAWAAVKERMARVFNFSSQTYCVLRKPQMLNNVIVVLLTGATVALASLAATVELSFRGEPLGTVRVEAMLQNGYSLAYGVGHGVMSMHSAAMDGVLVGNPTVAMAQVYVAYDAIRKSADLGTTTGPLLAPVEVESSPLVLQLLDTVLSSSADTNTALVEHLAHLLAHTEDMLRLQQAALTAVAAITDRWLPVTPTTGSMFDSKTNFELGPFDISSVGSDSSTGDFTAVYSTPTALTSDDLDGLNDSELMEAAQSILLGPRYLGALSGARGAALDVLDNIDTWNRQRLDAMRLRADTIAVVGLLCFVLTVVAGWTLIIRLKLIFHARHCWHGLRDTMLLSSNPDQPVCCAYHYFLVWARRAVLYAFFTWSRLWRPNKVTIQPIPSFNFSAMLSTVRASAVISTLFNISLVLGALICAVIRVDYVTTKYSGAPDAISLDKAALFDSLLGGHYLAATASTAVLSDLADVACTESTFYTHAVAEAVAAGAGLSYSSPCSAVDPTGLAEAVRAYAAAHPGSAGARLVMPLVPLLGGVPDAPEAELTSLPDIDGFLTIVRIPMLLCYVQIIAMLAEVCVTNNYLHSKRRHFTRHRYVFWTPPSCRKISNAVFTHRLLALGASVLIMGLYLSIGCTGVHPPLHHAVRTDQRVRAMSAVLYRFTALMPDNAIETITLLPSLLEDARQSFGNLCVFTAVDGGLVGSSDATVGTETCTARSIQTFHSLSMAIADVIADIRANPTSLAPLAKTREAQALMAQFTAQLADLSHSSIRRAAYDLIIDRAVMSIPIAVVLAIVGVISTLILAAAQLWLGSLEKFGRYVTSLASAITDPAEVHAANPDSLPALIPIMSSPQHATSMVHDVEVSSFEFTNIEGMDDEDADVRRDTIRQADEIESSDQNSVASLVSETEPEVDGPAPDPLILPEPVAEVTGFYGIDLSTGLSAAGLQNLERLGLMDDTFAFADRELVAPGTTPPLLNVMQASVGFEPESDEESFDILPPIR